jgi:trigger factor
MQINLKNINGYTKELICTVPWKDLKDSFQDEFDRMKSNHTPKGGRKGRVFGRDLELFKKNYITAIEANFAEKSLNEYYQQSIQEENLTPIDQAKVSNLDFSKEKDLCFTLSFQVVPDIKLPSYQKKFKINMTRYNQSDEDVELSLNELREQHSNIKTVDGGAKSGHFIMGDFQELDESDLPIIGKKMEKQYIKLGIGAFTEATEKDLLGVKSEEKRKVTVNYGEGKKARYEIHIHKVEEQVLPDLNDDFAITVSPDLKSLDELKSKVKENIQRSIDDDYDKRKRQELINYFVSKTKFEAPDSMVNRYLDKLIEEKSTKDKNLDKEKFREESKPGAEFNVKWFIIKDMLLETAEISINDDDIKNEIDKIVKESNEEEQKIREFFSDDNNKGSLASNLLNDRLFTHISEFSVIKDKEKNTSELRKPT